VLLGEGVLKIMDFGIARVSGSQQLTRTGDFQGTLAYASPEQIRGERVDERSDLYSLAIVLYKLLAGVAPFDGIGDYALMTAHLQTPPPPLRGRVPELDVPIEEALMQALAKRPEDRFASVAEFGRAVGAAALRNEAADILQQLFDRAFRDNAEATRVISTTSQPEAVEPPTAPTPQRTPWPTTDSTPQPTPQAIPQPSLADLLPRGFSMPATAEASEPAMSRSASARPRAARWPYAVVGGGMVAALGFAGWVFLVPAAGDRAAEPSLAQEQRQPAAAAAGKASDTVATNTEPSKPIAERPAPAQPEPSMPAERPSAAAEERPPAAGTPPAAPVSQPPVVAPAASVSQASVVAPAADKPAAIEAPPAAQTAAAPPVQASDPPRPPPEPAPSVVPPAKPEVAMSAPQPAETRMATTESPPSAEKPAPLGPETPAPAREPEGKPDLQGKVTGAKGLDEIEVNSQWVRIYGIRDRGQNVKALLRYLAPARNLVVCYRKQLETYRYYSDGQDIARLGLQDGSALAPNAPTNTGLLVRNGNVASVKATM
jgi:hypothetical protein